MREGRQIAEPEGMTQVCHCFLYVPPVLKGYFVKKQAIRRWQEPAVGRDVTSLAMQVDTADSARICLKNSLMPILRSEEVVWDIVLAVVLLNRKVPSFL